MHHTYNNKFLTLRAGQERVPRNARSWNAFLFEELELGTQFLLKIWNDYEERIPFLGIWRNSKFQISFCGKSPNSGIIVNHNSQVNHNLCNTLSRKNLEKIGKNIKNNASDEIINKSIKLFCHGFSVRLRKTGWIYLSSNDSILLSMN